MNASVRSIVDQVRSVLALLASPFLRGKHQKLTFKPISSMNTQTCSTQVIYYQVIKIKFSIFQQLNKTQ